MRGFRLVVHICLCMSVLMTGIPAIAKNAPAPPPVDPIKQERLHLYQRMEAVYGIPWTYLAAFDQYERAMKVGKKQEASAASRLTAIDIPADRWCGPLNPDQEDTNPVSIRFFGGMGVDGDGDGKAERTNDMDVLTAVVQHLAAYGFSREDWRIGLWMYYQRGRAVRTIDQFARIYDKYRHLNLEERRFPIPRNYSYSYRSTWGDARGWGGRRIHEGTDIFAGYGTPVLSTSYGMIEVIGWNRYGGWRIGIRDMSNVYHYYAHLSGFRKGLKVGDIVEPGQVIGYVGSSGYGKPGTSGKFPPHLHYGMYRETGDNDWAFDPYPYLLQWERRSRKR